MSEALHQKQLVSVTTKTHCTLNGDVLLNTVKSVYPLSVAVSD